MSAPLGYGLYLALKNNPALQWTLGIGAGLAAFLGWQRLRDNRIRKDAVEDMQQDIKEQTDDRIKRVEEDRRTTADLNDAERLRLATGSPHNRGRLHRP